MCVHAYMSWVHVCELVYLCACSYGCMHVYSFMNVYMCVHACMSIHMHVSIRVHVCRVCVCVKRQSLSSATGTSTSRCRIWRQRGPLFYRLPQLTLPGLLLGAKDQTPPAPQGERGRPFPQQLDHLRGDG